MKVVKRKEKEKMINGTRIKELLREKGMDQKDLAEAIGVTASMMTYIIKGLRDTTVTNAARMAKVLGVKIDEIVKV